MEEFYRQIQNEIGVHIERIVSNRDKTAMRFYAHGLAGITDAQLMTLEKKLHDMLLTEMHVDVRVEIIYVKDEVPEASQPAESLEKPKKTTKKQKKNQLPDMLFGRIFKGEPVKIKDITLDNKDAVISGEIFDIDARTTKSGKFLYILSVTDDTDSIFVKKFVDAEEKDEFEANIKKGMFVTIKGAVSFDDFEHEISMFAYGFKKAEDFRVTRKDTAPRKRVELHCHTKMSDMDGVADVTDLIKQAKAFGHEALAITDHGVVQSFPIAAHACGDDLKIIYGMEAYLIDDTRLISNNDKGQSLMDTFVVFDLETTGLNANTESIIEIGAVKVEQGNITDRFSAFVNPKRPLPYRIVELTKITDDMLIGEKTIDEVLPQFAAFCDGAAMVAHNAAFDMSFLKKALKEHALSSDITYLDTVPMAHILMPELKKYKLDTVAKNLGVSLLNHHRAVDDAYCTAEIFCIFIQKFKERGITMSAQLNDPSLMTPDRYNKLHNKHCILLARNDIGRVNLYRLVSLSHLKYFHKKPRVPKSEIMKHREGLIIGSACEAGELYQAIIQGRDEEEIERLASFYDYLEIQPIGNNAFYLREERFGIRSEEDLQNINRRIVNIGKKLNKPVVATSDVHFIAPEDEVYRRIIMAGKGFKDADLQPPLYYHTTDEMLKECAYLGEKTAMEVVVDNTIKIASMIEKISPVRPDKCPPVIENSDEDLRNICYEKAHAIYGDPLPEVVSERLERELNSIISNGYAVMYIIAQKLVWKSNEDGYLVGSRGSVGSSFVATMAGISEVNPLSPHYICPHCHYSEFDGPEIRENEGVSGFDLPDKNCPHCNHKMNKDGFNIPFETFLGFKGNKEPDIDLNFAGDYLNTAHKYTEVIFGKGQTFRAGTVSTLQDKKAFGYVKAYFDEKNVPVKKAEINRLVKGCSGVRLTTGQHPGGIIVLPFGEEIDSFTPVQHPPKDDSVITTHFEYHSIDENLLKLDILGKDDPSQIRLLEDMTGFSSEQISFDDKKVLSLFKDTSALGLEPEEIFGCEFGTLGIPEFGTDFAMGILKAAQPESLADLVRIAGLSHGTNVWQTNAETLIAEGKATIKTAICTRDDIMLYLISMGLESERSFKIMESVRKGKVAKKKESSWEEWRADMESHGVPEWYIWSCERIEYMFPKAHAAAYVMMAFRIGYYKVYYPLAYYAAYFTIRAEFDYEKMCQGVGTVVYHIEAIEEKGKTEKLKAKDKALLRDLKIVHEMYMRGLGFMPIDLYQSDATKFQIVGDKILPPFSSIEGMGDTASISLYEAAKEKPFASKDELKQRGKISSTSVETMTRLGLLNHLPESNQLSFFDVLGMDHEGESA